MKNIFTLKHISSVIHYPLGRWIFPGLLLIAICFPSLVCTAQSTLNRPQKIVIDAKRNRLIVSNDTTTGNLVQIDSAGNQSIFVQNAGCVDGLEIVGDTVYGVGYNRKVRGYNLETGELVMNITIAGNANKYLSSITYDSAGCLFISCPFLNEIYRLRISDQTYWTFANNNGLYKMNKPNGILLEKEKNRILVIDDSPNTSIIHAISLSDSSVSNLVTVPFNSPDGIVRDKYGYYYVGGYYLPGIYRLDPDFGQSPEMIFAGNSMVYPTYDASDHSLLITYYDYNSWARIPLSLTGLKQENTGKEPKLYPISPNPIKNEAIITFDVNKLASTRIDVYDTNGLLVNTLVNENKNPGQYIVTWEGKNNTGKQVVNGIYLIRLTVNGFVQTKKAIISR